MTDMVPLYLVFIWVLFRQPVVQAVSRPLSGTEQIGPSADAAKVAAAALSSALPSVSSFARSQDDAASFSEGEGVIHGKLTDKTPEQVLQAYVARFRIKRAQQWRTTEDILAKSEYETRYRLSQALVDEIFRTLRRAQRTLEALNLSALPPVPLGNETILDAAVATWENTAFLVDFILRMPDMLHLQIDDHAVRKHVLAWAVRTCLDSPVFADPSFHTPLRLALQEMSLAPPDENYVNPYRDVDNGRPAPAPVRRRARMPRGPRLSRAEL